MKIYTEAQYFAFKEQTLLTRKVVIVNISIYRNTFLTGN